jgi:TolB-like protein
MFKNITFLLTLFLVTSCTSIIHKKSTALSHSKIYAITSFSNYSQTPMAGLSAASIVESVLAEQNIAIHSLVKGSEDVNAKQTQKALFKLQKATAKSLGADYLITGEVQEWQYKTGIDGEPVVSYSIKVIDLSNDSILFNGVGAKSSWGHKSIGVVAQEIAKDLIPKFIQ